MKASEWQTDLEELRKKLQKTIGEWLEESVDSDEAVKLIRYQLKNMGKKVIEGNPSLTEMSLVAYSEIMVYSKLLQQNPKAMPDQISQDLVIETKRQVKVVWKSLTTEERKQILTTPGLWIVQRTLLSNGSESEKAMVRKDLLKLAAKPQTTAKSEENSSSDDPIKKMLMHNSLMAIQQTTFNHYMWCQSFRW